MKFISLIFFAAAMTGTWLATHGKRSVEESVHVGIQNDLKRIIKEYVQGKAPQSSDLVFDTFYTRAITPTQVLATFAYTFNDRTEEGQTTKISISGTATLNKTAETAENSTWNLDQLHVSDTEVDFTEPVKITADRADHHE